MKFVKNGMICTLVSVMVLACGGERKNTPTGSSSATNANGTKGAETAKGDSGATKANTIIQGVLLPTAKVNCAMPTAMTLAEQAGDVPGMLDHLSGKYELQEVVAYAQRAKSATETASMQGGVKIVKDGDVMKPELQLGCRDSDAASVLSLSIDTATTIYAPSNRVTVFNVGDGRYDNVQFNFPTLVKIQMDSIGSVSYKNDMGPAPYNTNLTFSELAAKWPKDTKLSVRTDGKEGFQVLYTEPSDANGQYTRVLMTFQKVKK